MSSAAGAGGIIDEVLKYRSIEHVVYVELDPGLFELASRYLDESWRNDSRVEPVRADGRVYLVGATERFDVILMNMRAAPVGK